MIRQPDKQERQRQSQRRRATEKFYPKDTKGSGSEAHHGVVATHHAEGLALFHSHLERRHVRMCQVVGRDSHVNGMPPAAPLCLCAFNRVCVKISKRVRFVGKKPGRHDFSQR
jgi:hypothetical protein